jgi:peptidoglycan/LPS O-acetylase OafA/YrhL
MGLIRFLLANAVVLAHTGPVFGFTYFDPMVAVQSFYCISGFYMALILNEKYTGKSSYRLFLSNRLLRILPAYYCIALLTLVTAVVFHLFWYPQGIVSTFTRLPLFSKIYFTVINLTVIGQDSTLFMAFDAQGGLHFTNNFVDSVPRVQSLLLCPTAWSLSLELMFYGIAPFLVKRGPVQVALLLFSAFLLRVLLHSYGYTHDPWTYRFFPTELFFFLAGVLSYRLYVLIRKWNGISRVYHLLILMVIVLFMLEFGVIPLRFWIKRTLFHILFCAALPFIFSITKKNSLDRFLGDLSYPIYLLHLFVIFYIIPVVNRCFGSSRYNNQVTVIVTICGAVVLVKLLLQPIDAIREKRVAVRTAAMPPAHPDASTA